MTYIIGISGNSGRINKELIEIISRRGWKVVYPKTRGSSSDLEEIFSEGIDLFIDFSHAELWPSVVQLCMKYKTALISGTTGISNISRDLQQLAAIAPVVHSSNFSTGIYYIKYLLSKLDVHFEDIRFEEEHHIHKKDAPSGTAIELCRYLNFPKSDVSVIRKGEEVGRHKIELSFDDQQIVIEHCARSKAMFAQGAVSLVPWLLKKNKGAYTMEHYMSEVKLCPLDTQ